MKLSMKNYLLNNVFEIPEFKFDVKKLKHTYLNNKNIWATYGKGKKDTILPRKNSLHTKYVDKEDVIEHISQIKDYENIIDNIKFFKTCAKGSVTPHTDKRNVAINIPVEINESDEINFYEDNNSLEVDLQVKEYNKKTSAKKYINPKLIETFVSKKVFCLNTSAIHGIVNSSDKDRIILSISFKGKYDDYNLIKDMYKNGQLI